MSEIPSHLKSHLEEAMAGLRVAAMELFAKELVLALKRDGWQFEEFLDGLTSYAYEQSDWSIAVRHLEDAVTEIRRVRREGRR